MKYEVSGLNEAVAIRHANVSCKLIGKREGGHKSTTGRTEKQGKRGGPWCAPTKEGDDVS